MRGKLQTNLPFQLTDNHIGTSYPGPTASGLVSPSGVYGVPPGGEYSGLAIQHGSVSGNLQQYSGAAPTRPVSYRPPVPQGLIESIGQSVQHQDTFGVKIQQQSSIYLPPPTQEIPLPPPPSGLESLPLEQGSQLFVQHHNHNYDSPQAQPLIQEPRYTGVGGSNCGHGPQLNGLGPSQSYPSGSGYDSAKSNYNFDSSISSGTSTNILSNYNQPAALALSVENHPIEEHSPTSSYGPPPSGPIASDSEGFDSQLRTSALTAEASDNIDVQEQIIQEQSVQDKPQQAALTQTLITSEHTQDQSQSTNSQEHLHIQVQDNPQQNQLSNDNLPGLSGSGLDIISSQKSQSVTIPVQGTLGSYQLQFQAADPLGSVGNSIDAPNHQQFLSEGLLQSILSAIEQPDSNSQSIPQTTFEELHNHSDVDSFINSQAGQEVLAEPKIQ